MPIDPTIPLRARTFSVDLSPLERLVDRKREDERFRAQEQGKRDELRRKQEERDKASQEKLQAQFQKEVDENTIQSLIDTDIALSGGLTPQNIAAAKQITQDRRDFLQAGVEQGFTLKGGTRETDGFSSLLDTDPARAHDLTKQSIASLERRKKIEPQSAPSTKTVIDTQTGKEVFATNEQIQADPGRFAPKPTGSAGGADKVQSAKILPGGVTQLVMQSGEVRTLEPSEANEALIKAAEERGAELQGLRAGERGAASAAIKQSAEAYKTLLSVRQNIRNMDEGIRLLGEGASTGAIQGRLPSIKAASVKLDNLRNRLGLDVIGGTTFGALSESELAFALSTALPTGLDEKELKQWMMEKREAQHKLATNLEEAASFLGTPGNTVADFIEFKKSERDAGLSSEEQAELEQLRQEFSR